MSNTTPAQNQPNEPTQVAIIKRDGIEVARVEAGKPWRDGSFQSLDSAVLRWFHVNTSQSMDWAIRHSGYSVETVETVEADDDTAPARGTVYLGHTAENAHVYADIRIEAGAGKAVTFTDHTTGPAPLRVSVSFVVLSRYYANPDAAPDAYWERGGQTPAADRVIVDNTRTAMPTAVRESVEAAWISSHLNDMNAACDHMTPDTLTPDAETLAAYKTAKTAERGEWREKYSPAFYGDADAVQKWRLDNVTCPTTGYKYGRAWLAKTPAPEAVAALRAALKFAL